MGVRGRWGGVRYRWEETVVTWNRWRDAQMISSSVTVTSPLACLLHRQDVCIII